MQTMSYVHGQSSWKWFVPLVEFDKPIQTLANKEPMHRSNNWLDLYDREDRQIKRHGKRNSKKLKTLQMKRLGHVG